MLYFMLAGQYPFEAKDSSSIREKVILGKFSFPSSIEKTISPEVIDLTHKLLTIDYKSRPTANDVMEHPWILGKKLQKYDFPFFI